LFFIIYDPFWIIKAIQETKDIQVENQSKHEEISKAIPMVNLGVWKKHVDINELWKLAKATFGKQGNEQEDEDPFFRLPNA